MSTVEQTVVDKRQRNVDAKKLARWAPVGVLVAEIIFFGIMRFDKFFTSANFLFRLKLLGCFLSSSLNS